MKNLKVRWWEFWKWKNQAQILWKMVADTKRLHSKDLAELHAVKCENQLLKETKITHTLLSSARELPKSRCKKV